MEKFYEPILETEIILMVMALKITDQCTNILKWQAIKFLHIDNKKNYILILGKGPTQGLDNTTLTSEKMYSPNFNVDNKKFCLSLYYNGDRSYLFVNGKELVILKPKILKLLHIHYV